MHRSMGIVSVFVAPQAGQVIVDSRITAAILHYCTMGKAEWKKTAGRGLGDGALRCYEARFVLRLPVRWPAVNSSGKYFRMACRMSGDGFAHLFDGQVKPERWVCLKPASCDPSLDRGAAFLSPVFLRARRA